MDSFGDVPKIISDSLSSEDFKKLPDNDLIIIDNLWKEYSREKFGFSPQVHIYKQQKQDYYGFCNSVGWRKEEQWVGYNDLCWTLDAPFGHLPWVQGRRMYLTGQQMRGWCFSSLSLASGEIIISREDTIISILSQKGF